MKNAKSKKTALITSIMTIILCLAMLVGSTYAWFTDEVTTAGNVIQSGTLEVDLLHHDENSWISLDTNKRHKVFEYNNWEPGYTQVETLKVTNEGSLAFQYQLGVTIENVPTDTYKIADKIDVYVYIHNETNEALSTAKPVPTSFADITASGSGWVRLGTLTSLLNDSDGLASGIILTSSTTDESKLTNEEKLIAEIGEVEIVVALHMVEDADNNYQGLSIGDVYLKLIATQYSFETDSFNNDSYDSTSTYPQN